MDKFVDNLIKSLKNNNFEKFEKQLNSVKKSDLALIINELINLTENENDQFSQICVALGNRHKDDTKKAKKLYLTAIQSNNENGYALFYLGELYFKNKQYEQAIEQFLLSLEYKKTQIQSYLALNRVYKEINDSFKSQYYLQLYLSCSNEKRVSSKYQKTKEHVEEHNYEIDEKPIHSIFTFKVQYETIIKIFKKRKKQMRLIKKPTKQGNKCCYYIEYPDCGYYYAPDGNLIVCDYLKIVTTDNNGIITAYPSTDEQLEKDLLFSQKIKQKVKKNNIKYH